MAGREMHQAEETQKVEKFSFYFFFFFLFLATQQHMEFSG